MDCFGVSSLQNLQALSALLSTQQEEEDDDDECKVRYFTVRGELIPKQSGKYVYKRLKKRLVKGTHKRSVY